MFTCRTHYFEHAEQQEEVMSLLEFIAEQSVFDILYLNLFTIKQIEAYMEKVCDQSSNKTDILNEIEKQPHLREMMQTPVLLDMILKIFPEIVRSEQTITLSLVYEMATRRWIKKEKKEKRLTKISGEDVIKFMQELAFQMHREDTLTINYKKLRSETFKNFQQQIDADYTELDAFYGEIRTCTFLTRDSLGDYRFAHKSFMEYFTASYLAPLLLEDKAPEIPINNEIRQFLHYMLLPKIDYANESRFHFNDPLWQGMKKCNQHKNCFIHLKDNSHMVWISPGQFIAGGEMFEQEKPTRIMQLKQGAFIDKYLVTNAQYAHFLNECGKCEDKWIDLNGKYQHIMCRLKQHKGEFIVEKEYQNQPVNFVSFYGVEQYAQWAGKEILSEWLWEKAGRGIDGRSYPWGEIWDWEKCNSAEHWIKRELILRSVEEVEKWVKSDDFLKTNLTSIDSFQEYHSPFYCLDLSGNLWEWMIDLYKKEKEEKRVLRGGAFYRNRNDVRLAYRHFYFPLTRYNVVGFRLSRTS